MEPIRILNDHLLVLDQRKLPQETVWLRIENVPEMARAIRSMALRGAPLIGIAAAYSLALEASRFPQNQSADVSLRRLEDLRSTLADTRPTAVNLSWALARMLNVAREIRDCPEFHLQEALQREALRIHDEDKAACSQIGKHGADIVPSGTLLTHCNTGALATGGDGTAYAIIKEAHRRGKLTHVFVCESRPYLQGARLTAYELLADGIPFTLITDSMAGHFMSTGKVNGVVVGADRIAKNGDTANKIGTYSLAVLANENGIPFYVAAPISSIDFSIPTGQEIPIEERDPNEVTRISGVSISPEGTLAAHPAFDVTPARYVTVIVTEKGIANPPFGEQGASLAAT